MTSLTCIPGLRLKFGFYFSNMAEFQAESYKLSEEKPGCLSALTNAFPYWTQMLNMYYNLGHT